MRFIIGRLPREFNVSSLLWRRRIAFKSNSRLRLFVVINDFALCMFCDELMQKGPENIYTFFCFDPLEIADGMKGESPLDFVPMLH